MRHMRNKDGDVIKLEDSQTDAIATFEERGYEEFTPLEPVPPPEPGVEPAEGAIYLRKKDDPEQVAIADQKTVATMISVGWVAAEGYEEVVEVALRAAGTPSPEPIVAEETGEVPPPLNLDDVPPPASDDPGQPVGGEQPVIADAPTMSDMQPLSGDAAPAEDTDAELAPTAELDEMIRNAVASLDPANDENWTADGLPSAQAVSAFTGVQVERVMIDAVVPDLRRPEQPAT